MEHIFENLVGKLLISVPSIEDKRFEKSVILMCGHDANGAIGLVVNKLSAAVTFKSLLRQLNIDTAHAPNYVKIHSGGPVETGRGFILHSSDFYHQTTVKITNQIYLTATKDILEAIANKNGPEKFILALGYSGWISGQIEREMQTNSWVQAHATPEIIFEKDLEEMWGHIIEELGIQDLSFSHNIGHG